MTPEQTVTFIEILNQIEVLSFSGEDPVVLDLGAGTTVVIWADGTQRWWLNEKKHRTDGPAVIYAGGTQFWFLNGQLHRTDGPAEIWFGGTQRWYLNGQRHRTDGPAEIWADGTQRWWLTGEKVTQKEHNQRTGR